MLKFALSLLLLSSLVSCARLGLDEIEGVREPVSPLNVRWAKNLDPIYETGNLPIDLGAPTIDQSRLYIADGSGRMTAYALEDGRKLWQVADRGASHAGALVQGENLYYGTAEGRLIARNRTDGKELWSIDLGASVETSPTVASGRLFVQLRNHQVFALDAATGKILWAFKRAVPMLTTLQRASRPIVWNNKLYVGFADGNIAAFSVEEGIMLWERKISSGDKFVDVDMTPTFFNGQLWIGSSSAEVNVLDPKTGRTIRTIDVTSSHKPLRYGDVLIFGSTKGEIVGVNTAGKILMRHLVADAQISSVNAWKNGFAVTDVEGNIYFVDAQEGKVLWRHHLGHSASGIFADPAVDKNRFALLSSRHRLYVFY